MCVPAYIQKVIFGSDIRFGMYQKIFSKIKMKMTGPTGNNEDCFPLPRNRKKKNSYNLMSVTVHFFFYFALLVCYCYPAHSQGLLGVQIDATNEQRLSRNRRLCQHCDRSHHHIPFF